jgi:sulfur carrier protein ThiS
MTIHIRIHPYLRQCISSSEKLVHGEKWDVPEGTTATHIVAMLNLPKGFPVIVMVNGASGSDPAHTVLREEDSVLISPVMAGG